MSSSTNYGFDLSKETWANDESKPNETPYSYVWGDKVATINEPHHPGGLAFLGHINNRGFLFVMDATPTFTEQHVVMLGIPSPEGIPKVQQFLNDTGLPLKLIITSGDFHHMALKFWLDAFTTVQVVHSSLKFPKTRNGAEILANDSYKQRITLTDGEPFPQVMLEYQETLQFMGFNQIMAIGDKEYMTKTADKKTTTKLGPFSYFGKVASEKADQPCLCIWAYHVPSKTLIYEHNFQMYITKDLKKNMPFLGKMLVPTEDFSSVGKGPIPKLPDTREACAKHAGQMAVVLSLDVRALLDYHCGCGSMVRQYPNGQDYVKEMNKILTKTGENEKSGDLLFQYMNSKGGMCC